MELDIESEVINHAADIIFKTTIFLHLWMVSCKPQDRAGQEWMAIELGRLHATNATSNKYGCVHLPMQRPGYFSISKEKMPQVILLLSPCYRSTVVSWVIDVCVRLAMCVCL